MANADQPARFFTPIAPTPTDQIPTPPLPPVPAASKFFQARLTNQSGQSVSSFLFDEIAQDGSDGDITLDMQTGIFTVKGPSKWLMMFHVSFVNASSFGSSTEVAVYVDGIMVHNATHGYVSGSIDDSTILILPNDTNGVALNPSSQILSFAGNGTQANVVFVKLA
jgi:hypothetical protein